VWKLQVAHLVSRSGKMQGGCLWVVPGEMKVGELLLLVYRVFPSVGSQVECGLLSGDALQK